MSICEKAKLPSLNILEETELVVAKSRALGLYKAIGRSTDASVSVQRLMFYLVFVRFVNISIAL
eukprot:scaffold93409_cov18-Prasinocladus_malaysianus.AAC.1